MTSGVQVVKETRESWLVLLVGFLGQALSMGFYYTFGTIYVALLQEYKLTETEAAWIGSIGNSLCFALGFLISYLCENYGCRFVMALGGGLAGLGFACSSFTNSIHTLFITYCIIASSGMGCLFFASLLCLPLYFQKHLVLANGICSSGSGVGGLVLSPFVDFLIRNYGVRQMFQIYSVLTVVPIVCGFLIRRKSMGTSKSLLASAFDSTLFKNKAFVLFTMSICLFLFAYYTPYVHLVNMAKLKGISSKKAALLVGIAAVMSTVGKLVFGKLSDVRCLNRLYLVQSALLILSVCLTLCTFSTNYMHLVIFCIIYGFFDGGFCSYIIVICSEIVSRSQISVAFGMMYTISSIFSLSGPPFAGTIYASTGSYTFAFMLCGGVFIVATLLLFLIPFSIPSSVLAERNLVETRSKREGSVDFMDTVIECDKNDKNVTLLERDSDSGFGSVKSSDEHDIRKTDSRSVKTLVRSYMRFGNFSQWKASPALIAPYTSQEILEGSYLLQLVTTV